MRGPIDEVIEAALVSTTAVDTDEEPPRPPGGKALKRLLLELGSAGLDEPAREALDAAVPEEQHSAILAQPDIFDIGLHAGDASDVEPGDLAGSDTGQVAALYAAVAEQLSLGPPTATGPQWRSLGPWTIPNGQTYGSTRVNVSGRVAAIAVDHSNPAHVLCGAAHGGVWESFNRGASWTARTDYAATLTVGALAFDPAQSRTVLCGTGEGNWWSYLGAGILRSTDGGTTWSTLCTAPFVGQGFYDLIIDPANGAHVLAATTGGLYESSNGGPTWTQRRASRTWSLSMAPAGGAVAEVLAGCADGVFRSTNGGTTWTAVALPGSPGTFDRVAVAIARSDPSVAYAWGARGSTPYLWRRAGGTWTAVGSPPGVATGQAWYDWFLAVAPDRATQIYCGAIEVHRGDLSGTTWSWQNITARTTGQSIHPDQHAIAFEPGNPSTIYVGNDGGLYRSPDRGATWQHCNNGLIISEFEYLAQDVGSSRWLIGGTQDNGTDRWTGSAVWEHVQDGDGGDCAVNRADPRIVFHTFFNMSPERSTARGNWASWASITPSVPAGEGSLFYPPLEASATSGSTVAIGGGALYVSRDNGTSWTRLAFPSAAIASAMYIPNGDRVYAGTTAGQILQTTWNGTSWSALTTLTTPRSNAYVSDLYVSPSNLNRIWVTYRTIGGARVFRSDNGGSTWIDRTPGLPVLPMNAVEVDPNNANRVWVAADLGVYQSLDGGGTWSDFSNALPNAFIGDLVFHPHARVLRAGTRNRGVWEIPVDGWMTRPVCGTQWTGQLAGNQTMRWFTFNWPATWHVFWTVIPTTPRVGAPQVTWSVQVERASPEYVTYWITVRNLTPDAVSFDGRYCILSRY